MTRKALLLLLLSVLAGPMCMADSYQIIDMNCQTVRIGGAQKSKGDTFSDNDLIEWDASAINQVLKVCALDGKNKGKSMKISKRIFEAKKTGTLRRYVNMIGRGINDDVDMLVLTLEDKEVLPIKIIPGMQYQMWYEDNIVPLSITDGRIALSSTLFDKGGRLVDVWIVEVDDSQGSCTPCYNCIMDLAF